MVRDVGLGFEAAGRGGEGCGADATEQRAPRKRVRRAVVHGVLPASKATGSGTVLPAWAMACITLGSAQRYPLWPPNICPNPAPHSLVLWPTAVRWSTRGQGSPNRARHRCFSGS